MEDYLTCCECGTEYHYAGGGCPTCAWFRECAREEEATLVNSDDVEVQSMTMSDEWAELRSMMETHNV